MKSTPAYAYLRVSSAGQADGHGFDRQEETITRFAKQAGHRILETYRDEHTGTEDDRPAFSAMVAAIKGNGVKTIIVESMDRFARSLSVQMALTTILEQEGITLLSASTGQDVTADIREDPMREAMVLMQGIFAQTEKKLLVRKLKRARDARRAEGHRVEGRKPYSEEIVTLVRKLRRRRKDGKPWSYQRIADELTRQGIPTKNGKPWSQGVVAHLLNGKTKLSRKSL